MTFSTRLATADDVPAIQRALYLALTWDGGPEGITFERAMAHEYVAMYHEDWGRPGDVGVIAELDETILGAAYGRLFTQERHGDGFIDAATPEIAIGVEPDQVGRGIGTRLLAALEDAYRRSEVNRLALSVNLPNPAVRLYERVGYLEIDRDDDSVRMIKTL